VVERLTQRLGRLVDDLLFLARQDSGIVQPCFSECPLDALLMEVVEEQQMLAAEKILNSLSTVKTTHASSGKNQSPREFEEDASWREEQVPLNSLPDWLQNY